MRIIHPGLVLVPLIGLVACSSSGGGASPCTGANSCGADAGIMAQGDAGKTHKDGSAGHEDGGSGGKDAVSGSEGAVHPTDGARPHDGSSVDGQRSLDGGDSGASQGPCSAGAVRCGAGNLVESCNA